MPIVFDRTILRFDQQSGLCFRRLGRCATLLDTAAERGRGTSSGGVAVAEDEVRVGFAGLQGDADGHLAERAKRVDKLDAIALHHKIDRVPARLAPIAVEELPGRADMSGVSGPQPAPW